MFPASRDQLCVFHSDRPLGTRHSARELLRELLTVDGPPAIIQEAVFIDIDLRDVSASRSVSFHRCTFQEVSFDRATFAKPVSFRKSRFVQRTTFRHAVFECDADFTACDFGLVTFDDATFKSPVSFHRSVFDGPASFARVKFQGADFSFGTAWSLLDLSGAVFGDPGRTSFVQLNHSTEAYRVYLARLKTPNDRIAYAREPSYLESRGWTWRAGWSATTEKYFDYYSGESAKGAPIGAKLRLAGCQVDDVDFGGMHWRSSPHDGRLLLQDELDLPRDASPASREVVSGLYRQLMRNLDAQRAYPLADECYTVALDVAADLRRRSTFEPVRETLRRGLRRSNPFSITGGYRVLSRYGTNYRRALAAVWIMLFASALAFALPASGVEPTVPTRRDAAAQACERIVGKSGYISASGEQACLAVIRGGLHALEVGTFSKTFEYGSTRLVGRVVELIEPALVAMTSGLALLAVRRRFRRGTE
jgi:hypothetical protein